MSRKELIEGVDFHTPKPASKKQSMALNNESQILVIGGAAGSGKTYLQQTIALKYIDDPHTQIINFRRTTAEITGQGGVWDTARDIYGNLHPAHRPEFTDSKLTAKFPSGAKSVYRHMEHAKDAVKNQGLQFTLCNFDEATLFEWSQIEYMFQRLRSKSKYRSRIVMSCNPDPDHKLRELLDWYLDEDGYPDPDKCGVERYFVRRSGEFVWGDTREELEKMFPGSLPLSFCFISSTIYDNPFMIESNPEYLSFLEGLNDVDKARMLHGNWDARPTGSSYFQREWLHKIDKAPLSSTYVRAWDRASTAPSDTNRYPDYTAMSPLMSKNKDGLYCLEWKSHKDIKDEESEVEGRFRKTSGIRDNLIYRQAEMDGVDTHLVFAVDPGSSGKFEFTQSAKMFAEGGFVVKQDPMPNNKNKLTRFTPFATAVENGLVSIVESSFPNKATLEAFYKELESFDGDRSTSGKKDDMADATASAFNYLATAKILKPFNMSGITGIDSQTRGSQVMKDNIPDI